MWRSQRGKIRVKDFVKCTIYLVIIGILFFFAGRIVPKKWFRYDRFPYRMLGFEKGGKIYQAIGIRKWKSTFPDMSVLLPKWMPSKKIQGTANAAHIELMVQETCIAECVHVLLAILGFGCVFIWRAAGGWVMALLYALGNLPYILIQRYNRPRLTCILHRLQERDSAYACSKMEYIDEESYHFELQHGTRT